MIPKIYVITIVFIANNADFMGSNGQFNCLSKDTIT